MGDDIGGFAGSPTPELLTRWMELGAFNPIYRNHAAKGTRNREPWVDGPEPKPSASATSNFVINCCPISTPKWKRHRGLVFR